MLNNGNVKDGVKKDIVEDKEYTLVFEKLYMKLKGWYGIDVQLRYKNNSTVEIELNE